MYCILPGWSLHGPSLFFRLQSLCAEALKYCFQSSIFYTLASIFATNSSCFQLCTYVTYMYIFVLGDILLLCLLNMTLPPSPIWHSMWCMDTNVCFDWGMEVYVLLWFNTGTPKICILVDW